MINKDTQLFGSFSKKSGNVGCKFFNSKFKQDNINAIYKSFSVDSIEDAINSAKCLKFFGFAVSMPYKNEIIKFLDIKDDIVIKTDSCNTVLLKEGKLYGYNTDFLSINSYINEFIINKFDNLEIYILGNGSYSKNVQICCQELKIKFYIITRNNWDSIAKIENSIIFNCTPLENIIFSSSNQFINCINTSNTGSILAKRQAELQYLLYTNKDSV